MQNNLTNQELVKVIQTLLSNKSKQEVSFILSKVASTKPSFKEFCQSLSISHYSKGMIGFKPFEDQLDVFDSLEKYQHTMCLAARQKGTTTLGLVAVLYYALFTDNANIVVVSGKIDSLKDKLDTMVSMIYKQDYKKSKKGLTLSFENGSHIKFISSHSKQNLEGHSEIDFLYVDDLNWIPIDAVEYILSKIKVNKSLFTSSGGEGNGNHRLIVDMVTELKLHIQPAKHDISQLENFISCMGNDSYLKQYQLVEFGDWHIGL